LHSRLLTLQRKPTGGRIVQTKIRDRDAWKKLRGTAMRILKLKKPSAEEAPKA
jgi:hypothetical protein